MAIKGGRSIETHGLKINFGKHKGELFTRLPLTYIKWMINGNTPLADIAKAELKRRGSKLPEIELSRHAIDRASLYLLVKWSTDCNDNEGLATWLERVTLEALAQGVPIGNKIHYKGMKFVIKEGEEFPILVTVMRNKNVGHAT
jgi:hypothetical protein